MMSDIVQGKATWARLRQGSKRWDDWVLVGHALLEGRAIAMILACQKLRPPQISFPSCEKGAPSNPGIKHLAGYVEIGLIVAGHVGETRQVRGAETAGQVGDLETRGLIRCDPMGNL